MLRGFEGNDDAAVYRIDDERAAVLTVDFFTPVVDDAYEFGCISAANALSDVFAMGGKPLVALNMLAFPSKLGTSEARRIIEGGARIVAEAGAVVGGGHTIDDDEPKYGLAVYGMVPIDGIVENDGARVGDAVFYTKRIGSGIMGSARKAGLIDDAGMRPVIDSMMELNKGASEAMLAADVHAATDVTGFGFAGHLHEMLLSSRCACSLDFSALPLFDGVEGLSARMCRPGRSFDIEDWARTFVPQGTCPDDVYETRMGVLCDPQTSGGLLVSIDPAKTELFASEHERRCGRAPFLVGHIVDGKPGTILLA